MLVVTDRVDDVVVGLGVKLALAPVGSPLTPSVIWPAKPKIGVVVTL
jgi:hypothetical protein